MDMQLPPVVGQQAIEQNIGLAIRTLLATLPANMEMLFYRDDDEPTMLEIQYPDGRIEIASTTETTGAGILEPAFVTPDALYFWRQIAIEPPEPLTDVLLWQVLRGLDPKDNTVIRIGFRRPDGSYIDSYSSTITGDDEVLDGITHWAPLPAGPIAVPEAP